MCMNSLARTAAAQTDHVDRLDASLPPRVCRRPSVTSVNLCKVKAAVCFWNRKQLGVKVGAREQSCRVSGAVDERVFTVLIDGTHIGGGTTLHPFIIRNSPSPKHYPVSAIPQPPSPLPFGSSSSIVC